MADKLRWLASLAETTGNRLIRWAVAEITRLREERRWIPVEERPPEVDSTVLVSWRYGTGPEQVAAQAWYDRHGRFTTVGDVEFPGVTHWQPLPAPASEGEVEE